MPSHATAVSAQTLINAAKAPTLAYNDKNWDKMKAGITKDFVYDEIATGRRVEGADNALAVWKGWAQAIPDSKATFHGAFVSGDTVILELTWKGTHTGPLTTTKGTIPASGKRIEVRACNVLEIRDEKVRSQRQYFDMATLLGQIGA